MATTNFVNLTTLFSFVLCLLVHFSGFLLDLAFQALVVFIRLYLFLLYQELKQLHVSTLVIIVTIICF